MYPRKCLLMFYNAFTKSDMDYRNISYGAANKTNLANIDMAKRTIENKFVQKKDRFPDAYIR